MYDLGALAGELCAERAVQQLAAVAPAAHVSGYGKACIVGTAGELEHSAAILHPKFGAPVRAAVGGRASNETLAAILRAASTGEVGSTFEKERFQLCEKCADGSGGADIIPGTKKVAAAGIQLSRAALPSKMPQSCSRFKSPR